MEKILIILSGSTNSGKTQTLNKLICKLQDEYPLAKTKDSNGKELKFETQLIKGDRLVIFDSINGKKIGINTAGDNSKQVIDSIKLFNDNKCDIVVCATKVISNSDNGSVSTMQKAILGLIDGIKVIPDKVIPLFKILHKGEDQQTLDDKDDYMVKVILDQLNRFI